MKFTLQLGFIILLICSCNSSSTEEMMVVSNRGPAQGSFYNITYLAPEGVDFRQSIDSILFVIDQSMSLWDPQSTISRLNDGDTIRSGVGYDHFMRVFNVAQKVSQESDGSFDISVAPLVNYWGFGPEARSDLDSAIADSLKQFIGYQKLTSLVTGGYLPQGMEVDMNAIAQGYTVDVVAEFLKNKGITNYLVEIGGEIKTLGKNARNETWTIGINKPSEDSKVAEQLQVIVGLDNKALATSGNYRKFWEDKTTGIKYVHTINPNTGYPVKTRLLSVTIVTGNCAEADAWATACMVMGLENAKSAVETNENLEAYFVYSDLDGEWEIWQTPGFKKMTK